MVKKKTNLWLGIVLLILVALQWVNLGTLSGLASQLMNIAVVITGIYLVIIGAK